ncbi:hypothetical protein EOL72_02955, partial [Candidatus Falkowbacteria bacterium]|nr:hypothetical protein [Candidatus Falkowbacteria bacterium]
MTNELAANSGSERDDRLKKLASLKELNIDAYPAQVQRDQSIASFLEDFDNLIKSENKVFLAGRLRAKREHGNLAFADLEDASGRLQLVFSKKELGPEKYKTFLK